MNPAFFVSHYQLNNNLHSNQNLDKQISIEAVSFRLLNLLLVLKIEFSKTHHSF